MVERGFQLRERIGEGGFGVVYRAYEPDLDREVAVKLIHPHLAGRPGFTERFGDEARTVARLEHPHIVPLYGFGTDDEGAWLVMRLLRGGSLKDALAKGPWRPGATALLVGQVVGALEVAHRHGVIHRDIKPGNVLIDSDGNGYLTDFGIAWDTFSAVDGPREGPGTPAYMAPELLRGEQPTEAADTYSLGLVALEMLTGTHPFAGKSIKEVLRAHLEEPVPRVTSLRPDLPAGLDDVIAAATVKDPTRRCLPRELADALKTAAEGAAPSRSRDHEPASRGNLPERVTSLVGRVSEMEAVTELLTSSRLITLTGVGGVGKTTLAVELGRDLSSSFADGAYLVELAEIDDPALVAVAAANALGVSEHEDRHITDNLTQYLATKHALLILDNCEHVIGAVADLTGQLLESAADVHVIATSRELLSVPGESVYSVPSLSLPPEANGDGPVTLEGFESVKLFVERAAASSPGFELNADNAPPISEICRRLDGMPLAIELAAARVRALSPSQIAERLDDRFTLLTGGSRRALPRQRTLQATIDWSYDLLSDAEASLVSRLSVFTGGFTLEAAETVCTGEGVEEEQILDLISQLVEKSMLTASQAAGDVRYGMLETVRQYLAERLSMAGEAGRWRERHAEFFTDLAERGRSIARQPEPWRTVLTAEQGNLRTALGWSTSAERLDLAGRIAVGLWNFWLISGAWLEASEWYSRLVDLDHDWPTEVRLGLLHGAGTLTKDYNRSQHYLRKEIEVAKSAGLDASSALNNLGDRAMRRGRLDEARDYFERALAERPDDPHRYILLANLGEVLYHQGLDKEAAPVLEESVAVAEAAGFPEYSYAEHFLAQIARLHGDRSRARELLEGWLDRAREHQLARADSFASNLVFLAQVERDEGRIAEAEALQSEAAEALLQSLDWLHGFVAVWATVALAGDQPYRAARLFGAADTSLEEANFAPFVRASELDAYRARLSAELDASTLEECRAEGAAMSIQEAIEYAKSSGP